MEEVNTVLSLFDSTEKWNAYIELANMKQDLVSELKKRLITELRKVAETNLAGSGWEFFADNKYNIYIKPKGSLLIGIGIEWEWWDNSTFPWCKRGACLWVHAKNANSRNVFNEIKSCRDSLPLDDFEENIENHGWLPFIKVIPSTIFDVDESMASVESCLYRAKDNATQLANDLWKEVFEPFANKECADKFCEIIKKYSFIY